MWFLPFYSSKLISYHRKFISVQHAVSVNVTQLPHLQNTHEWLLGLTHWNMSLLKQKGHSTVFEWHDLSLLITSSRTIPVFIIVNFNFLCSIRFSQSGDKKEGHCFKWLSWGGIGGEWSYSPLKWSYEKKKKKLGGNMTTDFVSHPLFKF